jgi:hypothetical protein
MGVFVDAGPAALVSEIAGRATTTVTPISGGGSS